MLDVDIWSISRSNALALIEDPNSLYYGGTASWESRYKELHK